MPGRRPAQISGQLAPTVILTKSDQTPDFSGFNGGSKQNTL